MNSNLILKYIENPDSMPIEAEDELKKILDEYPYFQTIHLLYIKHLHIHKSLRYAEQLKIAATYAGDRSLLFDLIKNKRPNKQEFEKAEKPFVEENKSVEINSEQSKISDTTEIVEEESKILDTQTNESENTNEPIELFDNPQLTESIESANNLVEIEAIDDNDDNSQEILDFNFDFDDTEEESNTTPKATENTKFDYNISPQFSDYMANFEKSKPTIETEPTNDDKKNRQSQLIDKFLDKQPRIIARQIGNEEPTVDISVRSVTEGEYMTETLAKIYVTQKNYQSAIKIYQKLSLKYPQKSSYFAEQIAEIKNLI